MRVFVLSVLVALGLGVATAFVLNEMQRPAYEVYSTSSTRIGDPGQNLVGPRWAG